MIERTCLLKDVRFYGNACDSWMMQAAIACLSYRMQNDEGPLSRQIALRNRTREFALQTLRLCDQIPRSMSSRHIADQLIRSSTSVAANYRAACRAKSRRDFISKIGLVLEEADESFFWLGLARDLGLLAGETLQAALSEADQLVAIFTATRSTARSNQRRARSASTRPMSPS
jgi:four helix bundle protein